MTGKEAMRTANMVWYLQLAGPLAAEHVDMMTTATLNSQLKLYAISSGVWASYVLQTGHCVQCHGPLHGYPRVNLSCTSTQEPWQSTSADPQLGFCCNVGQGSTWLLSSADTRHHGLVLTCQMPQVHCQTA